MTSAIWLGDGDNLSLVVREHELPIRQVDFRNNKNSSYYVSGTTVEVPARCPQPLGPWLDYFAGHWYPANVR